MARLAPSLVVLRREIDTRWPNRDRTSDGWIGDDAHASRRSDHNPNERDLVDAIDVDKDGVDMGEIIDAFERHPSAHYWIYRRQIADRDDNWRRRPYTGSNPHDKHLHGSIRQAAWAENDTRPWGLLEDDMTPEQLRDADVFPNGYGDAATNPTIAFGTFVRNVGRDTDRMRKELAELRDLVQKPVEVDYDKLADAIFRRAVGGTP